MTVYWDPSAWLKVYVSETHHENAQSLFEGTTLHVSSILSYVEIHAALAAMERHRRLRSEQTMEIHRKIEEDWVHFVPVLVDPPLVRRAAELAKQFALRGYDSVQLTSAETAKNSIDPEIVIASFDKPLLSAAREMGFEVWTR